MTSQRYRAKRQADALLAPLQIVHRVGAARNNPRGMLTSFWTVTSPTAAARQYRFDHALRDRFCRAHHFIFQRIPVTGRQHQPLCRLLQTFDMPGQQINLALNHSCGSETAVAKLQAAIAWRQRIVLLPVYPVHRLPLTALVSTTE
ncbi:hypothetical protein D3C72_1631150 [compost metagenome]